MLWSVLGVAAFIALGWLFADACPSRSPTGRTNTECGGWFDLIINDRTD